MIGQDDIEGIDLLERIDGWGATFAAAAVLRGEKIVAHHGDLDRVVRIASVTKLATAWATLLAVEEGAVTLDDPAGPPGSTVRHLLSHASGLSMDGAVLAAPGQRRMYSQRGYEIIGDHVAAATGIDFRDYLADGVLSPLAMSASELRGDAGAGLWSDVHDLTRLARELRRPTLLHDDSVALFRSPQFPDLAGVLPGWGRQDPCSWGLGPEIRASKEPHWAGSTAPPSTYGHFGGAGTFLWLDPIHDLACIVLTDREFDKWAVTAWPPFSDAVRAAYR